MPKKHLKFMPKKTDTQPASAFAPPGDIDTLREHLRARESRLPRRLGEVAAFALTKPEEMALGTTAEIARAAGVQPSTLVRFAQTLGYEGFSDMQAVFRRPYLQKPQAPVATGTLGGFLDAAARSVESARQSITEERFETAVDLLARAETIFLIARRRAFPIASSMAYTFGRMKIRSQLIGTAQGIEDEMLDLARPGDAALVVSFWPYSRDAVHQTRSLRERGLPVIALTDGPDSPVAALARVSLMLTEAEHEGLRLLSGSIAVATAITAAVAERRGISE